MSGKSDVQQGTLVLMVFKTLEGMGAMHGYGIARRSEQTSGDLLSLNYGPVLLKIEQEGYIKSEWSVSENNRKAKFYTLTRAGRKQMQKGNPPNSWESNVPSAPAEGVVTSPAEISG